MVTCRLILIKVLRTNTQVEWIIWFLLSRSFLKAGSLASQSQFNYFLKLIIVGAFTTNFNYSFHITAFCSDQTPSYLKLLVIINLYIKSTSIFDVFILSLIVYLNLWLIALILLLLLLILIDILVSKLGHMCINCGSLVLISIWIRLCTSIIEGSLLYYWFLNNRLFLNFSFNWLYTAIMYPFHL